MSEITESQQLLLSNLTYLNFDISEYDTIEELIIHLSEDEGGNTDYSNLKALNCKQAFYDIGILQENPEFWDEKKWQAGGNITEEEAIATIEAIKNNPDLMGMEIIAGEDYGVLSRNITLYSPKTNEMVIACRGTGAEEWLKNGEAIRTSDTSELYVDTKTYLDESLAIMKSKGHDITKLNYVVSGHSNGAYKADAMTVELLEMLVANGVSVENMHVRNTLFDGFYVSDAYWAENPEIKAIYEKMAAEGKLLRFCGTNDFVHGLGGKNILGNTIYIEKYNPDGGLLPPIGAEQHFSGLFYTREADGNLVATIKGYTDGSFSTNVKQGPIAVMAEEFSRNVVAMEDTVLADKLIHIIMGMMTKNKDSIPEDQQHNIFSMLGLLADPKQNRGVMELLGKTFNSSLERFVAEGREAEFWSAFESYLDKSVLEKLMNFDYVNGTDTELYDLLALVIVSFLKNSPDLQESIINNWKLLPIRGNLRRFFATVNQINVNNPPDDIGANFFAYINILAESAVELGLDIAGNLVTNLGSVALLGHILSSISLKNTGDFYNIKIDELRLALIKPNPVRASSSGIVSGGGSRSFPEKGYRGTAGTGIGISSRGAGRPFAGATVPSRGYSSRTFTSSGESRSFGRDIVVDNGELENAIAGLTGIESKMKSMRSSTQSLITDLRRELNRDSKISSSERREIRSTIVDLEKIYGNLGSKTIQKGKNHFDFILTETKKLEATAFTNLSW